MLECPDCERRFRGETCPRCGWSEKPHQARVPESSRLWERPQYSEPPATPEQIKAGIAELMAKLRAPQEVRQRKGRPFGLPNVDPAVRDALARNARGGSQ